MKESPVQQRIRLDAAYAGTDLWRNNSGALPDRNGRLVRYGLCNDDPALNKRIKSSDLIGVTPLFIMPQHVGQVVGVFTAIECKQEGWRFNPSDERVVAQAAFHAIVTRAGGYAGFATCVEDYRKIIKR